MTSISDLSMWEQHTDPGGRAYLANRATNETRWLWQKWAMNGRVFCVNIVTNDRIWQDDMTPEVKIAAGVTLPPPPPPPPSAPPVQQMYSYPQHDKSSRRASNDVDALNSHVLKRQRRENDSSAFGSMHYSNSVLNPVQNYPLQNVKHRVSRRSGAESQATFYCPSCNLGFHSAETYRIHTNSTQHCLVSSCSLKGGISENFQASNGALYHFSSSHFKQNDDVKQNPAHARSCIQSKSAEKRSSRFSAILARSDESIGNGARAVSTAAPLQNGRRERPERPQAQTVPEFRRSSDFSPNCKMASSMRPKLFLSDMDLSLVAVIYERDMLLSDSAVKENTTMAENINKSDDEVLVGTCQTLEKAYLRLTSAPRPSDVRPLEILKHALTYVKSCWKNQTQDYEWVCSQLKSIRQDFQIQHIETSDTLDAYQTHARIALENSDFGEFNTCVAQLSQLFDRVDCVAERRDEFASYRVLYNVLVGEKGTEFSRMLRETSTMFREQPCMRYAIHVRRAVLSGNYDQFFKLYVSPPPQCMATFLLDHMLDFMRSRALSVMCHAYSPTSIALSFVLSELSWVIAEGSSSCGIPDSANSISARDVTATGPCDVAVNDNHALVVNSLDGVFKFCERIGVKVEPSAKVEFPSYVVNAKESKSNGVHILYGCKGLITAAGAKS